MWREKGKYGFHTSGRTLRAEVNAGSRSYYGKSNTAEGIVVKQVRNVALLSASGVEDFTYENDFDDGIGALKNLLVSEKSPRSGRTRFARGNEIQYSLGKRKRWLIPEIVKTDSLDGHCSEGEKAIGGILLVERREHPNGAFRSTGDCEAVFSSRTRSVREPRHRFAHVGDLEPQTKDPCVRYEICRASPESTWPRNVKMFDGCGCCSCSGNFRNPNKSASKNKHFKNKGHRWGDFREHDLVHAKDDPAVIRCAIGGKRPRKQDPNGGGKVRVVSSKDVRKAAKYSTNNNCASFDIGNYIHGLLKDMASCDTKAPQVTQNECPSEIQGPRKIFVPEAKHFTVSPTEAVVPTRNTRMVFTPEKKLSIQLEVIRSNIEPAQLMQSWGELYREGMSHPRKFTIDLTTLTSSCHGNALVLFEHQEVAVDSSDVVSTSVSLIATCDTVTDSDKPFTDASLEFSRNMEVILKVDILFTVKDIIDVALLAVDKCVSKETIQQEAIATCKKPKAGIKAFQMLNKAIGVDMTPTTVAEAWQEIKRKCAVSSDMGVCSVTDKEQCCNICFVDLDCDGKYKYQ